MNRPCRQLLILLAVAAPLLGLRAQRVTWNHTVERLSDTSCRIILEAEIPQGYHLYDLGPYDEGVAFATVISLRTSADARPEGEFEMLDRPVYHTDANGNRIGWFEHRARFARTIRLTGPRARAEIHLEWMICSATSCMLPDELDLSLDLSPAATSRPTPTERHETNQPTNR